MATRRVSRKFPVRTYRAIWDGVPHEPEAHRSEAKIVASPDDWGFNTVTVEMSRADMLDMLRDAIDYANYCRSLPGCRNDKNVVNMLDANLARYRAMRDFVQDSRKAPEPEPEPTYSLNV